MIASMLGAAGYTTPVLQAAVIANAIRESGLNPDAKAVSPDVEIARLAPVVDALKKDGRAVSIDSFAPDVQRWAIGKDVDYLNDIRGFGDPAVHPARGVADLAPQSDQQRRGGPGVQRDLERLAQL